MTGSISFDHAADTYDATRALPPPVAAKLTGALTEELRAVDTDRLLEVGIGTGRIARPLMERGVRLTGVDIAPRMLAKLREQLGSAHHAPDLLLGDATALPFAPATYRAALMVHVLHLVSDVNAAIAELRRVLAPGGIFIHHYTDYQGANPYRENLEVRETILAKLNVVMRRRASDDDIRAMLRAAGGSRRREAYAADEERTSPREWLERSRNRTDSWTWQVPEAVFPTFMNRWEQWTRDHYGDLDHEYLQQVSYELEVWSFDGA